MRGAMGQAFCLRHRMQHFIENYVYYMMFEASPRNAARERA